MNIVRHIITTCVNKPIVRVLVRLSLSGIKLCRVPDRARLRNLHMDDLSNMLCKQGQSPAQGSNSAEFMMGQDSRILTGMANPTC